jgi:hypothetical protein
VLGLCAQAGLVSVGVVMIDGTKIKANASMDQNRGDELPEQREGRGVADSCQGLGDAVAGAPDLASARRKTSGGGDVARGAGAGGRGQGGTPSGRAAPCRDRLPTERDHDQKGKRPHALTDHE